MSVLILSTKPKEMVEMFWFTVKWEFRGGKFHRSYMQNCKRYGQDFAVLSISLLSSFSEICFFVYLFSLEF